MSTTSPAAFRRLDLRVRRLLQGRLHGDRAGLLLGPGSEPEEVVRYRPGEDDVRRIDWNVTARSAEPHVWRTRAEHELDTWVLLDDTASMHFGTTTVEKRDVAVGAAAAVGLLTDAPGNRTRVLRLASGGLETWRPGTGRRAARRLSLAPAPPRDGTATATLADGVRALGAHRRPGVRVVVSDLLESDGRTERPFAWEAPLRRLAARHEVVVVEVLDPRELEIPDVGPLVLEDPESGHRCEVWTAHPAIREQYADLARAHRAAVANAVRSSGAAHVVLRTDHDWLRELARFVRRQRRTPRSRRTR